MQYIADVAYYGAILASVKAFQWAFLWYMGWTWEDMKKIARGEK